MDTNKTDKTILIKGLKTMGISLACMFIGPTFVYIAQTNQEKPLYIPILILAVMICGLAIFFAFKGINTILDSIFKKK